MFKKRFVGKIEKRSKPKEYIEYDLGFVKERFFMFVLSLMTFYGIDKDKFEHNPLKDKLTFYK